MPMQMIMENFRRFISEGMKAVDCYDEEYSQTDTWEKGKDDKREPIRVIVQQRKCKLVSDETIQEDEGNQTDEEKLEKQRERDAKKRGAHRTNPLDDLNDDFLSLGRGIVETELIDEDEDITEKKEKERKKHCAQGNVFHKPPNEKDGGQFTDKDDAGSWSLQWSKSGDDCKGGVARVSGGSEKFVKQACGRKDKHGGKSKYKCGEK